MNHTLDYNNQRFHHIYKLLKLRNTKLKDDDISELTNIPLSVLSKIKRGVMKATNNHIKQMYSILDKV